MYRDPSKIRDVPIKVRFSREEDALLEALANYTGEQKAVLVRELILEAARHALECDVGEPGAEGPAGRAHG
jgi:uncharacterized protein (DUF1778 family)